MSLEVFVRYSTKKVFVKNIYRGFQLSIQLSHQLFNQRYCFNSNCDNGYGDDYDDDSDDIVGVHGGETW